MYWSSPHLYDPGVLWHLKAQRTALSTHSSTSSQVPVGPGANPGSHAHSNPPSRLAQVPLPQILGSNHQQSWSLSYHVVESTSFKDFFILPGGQSRPDRHFSFPLLTFRGRLLKALLDDNRKLDPYLKTSLVTTPVEHSFASTQLFPLTGSST